MSEMINPICFDGGLHGNGESPKRMSDQCFCEAKNPLFHSKQCAAARSAIAEKDRQLTLALKGKRPFSTKLADETIAGQVKEIDRLHTVIAEERREKAELARLYAMKGGE